MKLRHLFVAGVVASTAIFTLQGPASADSSTAASNDTVPASSNTNPELSGRNAFEAVFFGQGPEAAKLLNTGFFDDVTRGAILQNNSSDTAKRFVSVIENTIGSADGAAFDQFSANLRSGNPQRVRSASEKMATKARDAENAVRGAKVVDPAGPDGQLCGVTVLVGAAAIIAAAAIAVEAAVVFSSAAVGSQAAVGNLVVVTSNSFFSASNSVDQLAADQKLATLTTSFQT